MVLYSCIMLCEFHKPESPRTVATLVFGLQSLDEPVVYGIGTGVACVLIQLKKGTSHGHHNDTDLRNDNTPPPSRNTHAAELRCSVLNNL